MFIEDNGNSVEVHDPILQEKVRFLVNRGDDHRYHLNADVTWKQIEDALEG